MVAQVAMILCAQEFSTWPRCSAEWKVSSPCVPDYLRNKHWLLCVCCKLAVAEKAWICMHFMKRPPEECFRSAHIRPLLFGAVDRDASRRSCSKYTWRGCNVSFIETHTRSLISVFISSVLWKSVAFVELWCFVWKMGKTGNFSLSLFYLNLADLSIIRNLFKRVNYLTRH